MKEWDAKLKGLIPYKELAAKNESLKAGKSVIQKDSKYRKILKKQRQKNQKLKNQKLKKQSHPAQKHSQRQKENKFNRVKLQLPP